MAFFQDGVRFHDVGCNHKKPVICEEDELTIEELTTTTEKPSASLHVFLPPVTGVVRSNHAWNGQNYLLSWADGVSDLTWEQARDYCHNNAMRMLSMDTQEKTEHFFKQVYY